MTDTVNPIFTDEVAARAYLEKLRWPNGTVCVHCGAYGEMVAAVQNTGKQTKKPPKGKKRRPARGGLYYCNSCKSTFTVTVGSVMEDSHVALNKWLYAFFLLCSSKKGISSHQLHRTLGVSYKTAWFMSHRIREAMRSGSLAPPMMGGGGGVVEIDETIYGRASTHPKGRRNDPKRKITNSAHKNVILSLVERGGGVRSWHVGGSTAGEIIPIVNANVAKEAAVMTDSAALYPAAGLEEASPVMIASITAKTSTSDTRTAGRRSTPTALRTISACSSAACVAPTSTARKSTCTATWPSSTFATTPALLWASRTKPAPTRRSRASWASA
jgi:transposase-like protein